MVYFLGKIFSTTLLLPVVEENISVTKIVKKSFRKETFKKKSILEDYLLIFSNRNSRVVENIFPKNIGHTL